MMLELSRMLESMVKLDLVMAKYNQQRNRSDCPTRLPRRLRIRTYQDAHAWLPERTSEAS